MFSIEGEEFKTGRATRLEMRGKFLFRGPDAESSMYTVVGYDLDNNNYIHVLSVNNVYGEEPDYLFSYVAPQQNGHRYNFVYYQQKDRIDEPLLNGQQTRSNFDIEGFIRKHQLEKLGETSILIDEKSLNSHYHYDDFLHETDYYHPHEDMFHDRDELFYPSLHDYHYDRFI
jgi:hypothetical protein